MNYYFTTKNQSKIKALLILFAVICFCATVSAQQWGTWCYKDFPSNGTFTVPSGCSKVYFEAIGGGGAGGFVKGGHGQEFDTEADNENMYQVSGGGGGGAYGRTDINSGLTAGETFAITIGAGGYNTADRVTSSLIPFVRGNDYYDDINCGPLRSQHCEYKGFYWPYVDFDWDNLLQSVTYAYPFFKNHRNADGGTTSVKRNSTSSVILEAMGGKTCSGINNVNGAAGGAATGIGDYHYAGGNGGTGTGRCGGALGDMSSGGGGAAGSPNTTLDARHGGDGVCLMNNGWGRGGTGDGILSGAGGNGTSDWNNVQGGPRQGTSGSNYGGGGGGSKTGTLNWSRGGNGAPGFVRVWFYIDSRSITVTPTADPTTVVGSGSSTLTAGLANNLVQSGFYSTTYKWDNDATSATTTVTPTSTKNYCVTVTNTCTYATNSDACKATSTGCVTVNYEALQPGAVEAGVWVCSTTDTVVTISNTTSASGGSATGTYSWYKSTDNTNWGTAISGANAEQYTATETGYYRRGFSVSGLSTVYTPSVYVVRPSDIDPGMVKDADNNTEISICPGDNITLSLTTGTTLSTTWQYSTDGEHWTDITTLEFNNVTTKTFVRYLAAYTPTCDVPSNNIYTINLFTSPVVTAITPNSTCPGQATYTLTPSITNGSSATITAYYWDGGAASTNATKTVTATLPNCGKTYYSSLQVMDGNNCKSAVFYGDFTTTTPDITLSTLPEIDAVLTAPGSCTFTLPEDFNATLTANLSARTCGDTITGYSFAETPSLSAGETKTFHISSLTNICGTNILDNPVEVTVEAPAAPEIASIVYDDNFVCPGETTVLRASVTAVSDVTYAWIPNNSTADTLKTNAITDKVATAIDSTYTLTITDENGCTATDKAVITTTPKAYINNYTFDAQCTPAQFAVRLDTVAGNVVPANTDGSYNYVTKYTWTHTPVTGVSTTADAIEPQANFTTGATALVNSTLAIQTVSYTVTPHSTTTTLDESENNTCDGDPFTINVVIKPDVNNVGGITEFDNSDVIITLWYGACDTLYYVNTPTYLNNFTGTFHDGIVLSNNNTVIPTANAGALLGRIAPGTYTITWTLTDECNNTISFDKKYIVRYPNCGENDPNFTAPFRAEDADHNIYETVRIGCECWITTNLKTVTGAAVSNVYTSDEYPDAAQNETKFGRLYSWYTAAGVAEDDNTATPTVITEPSSQYKYVQGVCPEGWALPTMADLNNMVATAGGVIPVKSADQTTWLPGAAGTNASGFDARGAGYYDGSIDRYLNLLGKTYFWTCESTNNYQSKIGYITYSCPEFIQEDVLKGMGYSVRCLRRGNPTE